MAYLGKDNVDDIITPRPFFKGLIILLIQNIPYEYVTTQLALSHQMVYSLDTD